MRQFLCHSSPDYEGLILEERNSKLSMFRFGESPRCKHFIISLQSSNEPAFTHFWMTNSALTQILSSILIQSVK